MVHIWADTVLKFIDPVKNLSWYSIARSVYLTNLWECATIEVCYLSKGFKLRINILGQFRMYFKSHSYMCDIKLARYLPIFAQVNLPPKIMHNLLVIWDPKKLTTYLQSLNNHIFESFDFDRENFAKRLWSRKINCSLNVFGLEKLTTVWRIWEE